MLGGIGGSGGRIFLSLIEGWVRLVGSVVGRAGIGTGIGNVMGTRGGGSACCIL